MSNETTQPPSAADARDAVDDLTNHVNHYGGNVVKSSLETLRAFIANHAGQEGRAVAHAWYHRGLVNFDDSPELAALDDRKGTPIPLYLAPHPAALVGELRGLAEGWKSVCESGGIREECIDSLTEILSRYPEKSS